MSGTNRCNPAKLGGPAVILIDPQLGQNIGMVARAMLNCGLTDLRIVRPRGGWPNKEAIAAASGADDLLDSAGIYDTTKEAVADLHRLYATTARPRGMVKTILTPREAAGDMRAALSDGNATGILFGPERSGLVNDDIALADAAIAVPLNPAFSSLNLAQAVLLVGYEWFQSGSDTPARQLDVNEAPMAPKEEVINFFERLETALDETGFLFPPEKRPGMVRNLRNLFGRMEMTLSEVNTLHGIISSLRQGKHGAHSGEDEDRKEPNGD